jgi:hypothetical protein
MTKFVFTLNQNPLDFAEDVYLEIVSLAKQNKEFQVEIKPLKKAKTYMLQIFHCSNGCIWRILFEL